MIETRQADNAYRPWKRGECSAPVLRWPEILPSGERSNPETFGGVIIDAPPRFSPAQLHARRKIEKVLVYMLEHLDRTLPVPMLSAMAGLSISNFYLLFKLGTGFTPNVLHTRARMNRACGLLRETDLRVKEVANLLGYDDQYYFSRLFKLVNGLSPREYRSRMADKPGFSHAKSFDMAEGQPLEFSQLLPKRQMDRQTHPCIK